MKKTKDTSNKIKQLEQFIREKTSAVKTRQIRINNWIQNEQSYNGQPVQTLLTRSNLHIPKVFEGVQTMSSRLGNLPEIDYDTKPEGDENASELMKALWKEDMDACDGYAIAQGSKIEAGIYGRSIYKLIPSNSGNKVELVDTMAFLINPTAKSHKDALYCGQQFIYKTMEQIEEDAEEFKYDQTEIDKLKANHVASETSGNYSQEKSLKDLRLSYLGYANVTQLGAKLVEVNEWYTVIDKKKHVMTIANDKYVLRCVPISEVGLPRFPYVSWAVYPRAIAFWTPSDADILRDPNLAMDVSLNQVIDNATYRNFGMLFVDSGSGLKQSSIVPRPLGVTPVTVGIGKSVKDSLWQFTPPEISSAQSTLMVINNIADTAVGQSAGAPKQKGKVSVTEQANNAALVEAKNNLKKQNFVHAWKELADLYAETIKMNLTTPRKVKVYTAKQMTISGVTKKNFVDVDFMAKATPQEITNENRVLKQKAMVELYTLFKDDPKVPGQRKLREKVAKVFDMDSTEMGDLFTADQGEMAQQQAQPQAPQNPPQAPQQGVPPQQGMQAPVDPNLSQIQQTAQANTIR